MTLTIQNLTKHYGKTNAVDNLSIDVPEGQVFGLLGRNGAGKSTTIKMILGLVQPTQGKIEWRGGTLDRKKLSIGYLPEERGLYAKTKISDQLKYFGELEGMKRSGIGEKIDYWLERFGITEYKNKLAGELSKGNQQKIQLIGTLLHDPELIILDEPFSGLDPVNADLLSEVLLEEIKKNKTIILSSHQMNQVEKFCENICMLKDGKVVEYGKLQKVKEDYGYKNLSFHSDDDVLNALGDQYKLIIEGKTYITRVKKDEEAIKLLKSLTDKGISLQNFSMMEPSLHQIFVERTR